MSDGIGKCRVCFCLLFVNRAKRAIMSDGIKAKESQLFAVQIEISPQNVEDHRLNAGGHRMVVNLKQDEELTKLICKSD